MKPLFKILGVLLACYVLQSLRTGSVYAKSRAWGRTFNRDEEAARYWSIIVVYTLLSLALIFVF